MGFSLRFVSVVREMECIVKERVVAQTTPPKTTSHLPPPTSHLFFSLSLGLLGVRERGGEEEGDAVAGKAFGTAKKNWHLPPPTSHLRTCTFGSKSVRKEAYKYE